jgi:hypothetical protein
MGAILKKKKAVGQDQQETTFNSRILNNYK